MRIGDTVQAFSASGELSQGAQIALQQFFDGAAAAEIGSQVATQINDPGTPAHAALVAAAGDVYDPATAGLVGSASATGTAMDLRFTRRAPRPLNLRDDFPSIAGDGVADDTVPFLAAVARAAAERRPLDLSGGHFRVSETVDLSDGAIIQGWGQDPALGTPTRLNFSGLAADKPCFTISDGSNIVLSDFYITGKGSGGTADEIKVTGHSRKLTIERVTINTQTSGVGLSLSVGSGSVITSNFEQVQVAGAATGFSIGAACTSLDFSACYSTNASVGYAVRGTYLKFSACAVDHAAVYGYSLLSAAAVTMSGCGSELTGRAGFALGAGTVGVGLYGCRGVSNNQSGLGFYPSLVQIDNGADFIELSACVDTTPAAGTTKSVGNTAGALPTVLHLGPNKLAAGVHNVLTTAAMTAQTATAAPPAGAGGALPATPAGYATVSINGVARKIAYY